MLFVKWHFIILNMGRAQLCSIHLSAHMNALVSQLLDRKLTDRFLSKTAMEQFVSFLCFCSKIWRNCRWHAELNRITNWDIFFCL